MDSVRQWSDLSEAEQTQLVGKIHGWHSRRRRNKGKTIAVIYTGIQPKPQRKRKGPSVGYSERNTILLEMGFASYQAYLESDLWQRIRRRVLKRSRKCHVCGLRATEAHHRSYHKEALAGTDISGIFPICRNCHETIEFRERDGQKLNPQQATDKMKSLRRKRKKQAKVETVVDPLMVESEGFFRSIRESAHLGG